jgi:hypothetical protein
MPNNSKIIVPTQTHPDDSTVQSYTGDKSQADGYYGRADGFHTVQINLNNFSGEIVIQGTLAVDPASDDWFNIVLETNTNVTGTVDTTGAISVGPSVTLSSITYSADTLNATYNFTGNYVWVRAVVNNWTGGTIDSVMMNY